MIILLGLPKCGTMSFTESFRNAGFNPVHWTNDKGEYVAELILKAIREGKNLLHYVSQYDVITQMDLIMPDKGIFFFPQVGWYWNLYLQYPEAKFILNTRDVNRQVESIKAWGDLQHRFECFGVTDLHEFITDHYRRIRHFFFIYGKGNFLEFDIENDSNEKLSKFVGRDINLIHINKTE